MMAYKLTLIYFVLFVINLAYFYNPPREKVDIEMEKCGIVPDAIPVAPKETMKIVYPNDTHVPLGQMMTPLQVHLVPICHWETENGTFYTLLMYNPEFNLTGEKTSEWINWLTVNIPGNNVYGGELVIDYIGAIPPDDDRLHIYIFLVYAQRDKVEWNENFVDQWNIRARENFNIANFTQKYQLGDPVAGNYFFCRYDKTVPKLTKVIHGEMENYFDLESAIAPSHPPHFIT